MSEQPKTIVPRPEVVEAVAKMPPLRPEQVARLRRILHDWPAGIEARVSARKRDSVPQSPEPTEATPDPVEDTPDVTRPSIDPAA